MRKAIISIAVITMGIVLTGCDVDHTILLNVDENGDGQKEKITVDISSIDDKNTEVTINKEDNSNLESEESVTPNEKQESLDSEEETQEETKMEEDEQINESTPQERDDERLSEIKRIQTSLELYYQDHSKYPQENSTVILGAGNATCLGENGFGPIGCENPYQYMSIVPSDPLSPESNYTYISTNEKNYKIYFYLETDDTGFKAGRVQASANGIFNN